MPEVIPSYNGQASASFKFNSMEEIRSHSSVLFNERLAILFYLLDMRGMKMNTHFDVASILEVRGTIKQIYKNIRTLIRNNPTMRATLNLDTKDPGIYVTDIALGTIDRLIEFCEVNGYTTKRVYIIVNELNQIEMIIKDVLQYFSYFIRPDFRQKPDVEIATEKYKELADTYTVNELKELAGKKHVIDFEGLGTNRVELKQATEEEMIDLDEDIEEDESTSN